MNRVAILRDESFKKHVNSPGHPESPDRLSAIDYALTNHNQKKLFDFLKVRGATRDELLWVHSEAHVDFIAESANRDHTDFDYETAGNQYSYEAAIRAAGAVICAIDAAVSQPERPAYALVRPPGHHAERDRVMGFCLFNNVAVGAEYCIRKLGMRRVFIFDWDVHHGNGTMHSFYDSNKVLYSSVHQFPHYPGTGTAFEIGSGDGRGYTINLPLPPGSGDSDFKFVIEQILVPVIDEYNPEIILISAGFDAHRSDPLSMMRLSSAMFAEMASLLRNAASRVCEGRLVLTLEGGYSLEGIADANAHMLSALCGDWRPEETEAVVPDSTAVRLVERLKPSLGEYWRCF